MSAKNLAISFLVFAALVIGAMLWAMSNAPDQTGAENAPPSGEAPDGMVWVPAGEFMMGSTEDDRTDPNERRSNQDEFPRHLVKLDGFWMDATEVTNRQFKAFVDATGYVTTAEKPWTIPMPVPGSTTGETELKEQKPGAIGYRRDLESGDFSREAGAYSWAEYIEGACWKAPEGPGSSIEDRMDHPVVHVSWDDANAYCEWAGKELPTEAQWEYAARGGLSGKVYPWGSNRNPDGKWLNNIWQGEFPIENTKQDGFPRTAPVGSFPANDFGIYDMSGNVWEWCADFYRPDYYSNSPKRNPKGPLDSYDPQEPNIVKRVQRGGSFMCSDSYCVAYRISARGKADVTSGAFHNGFRCVKNVAK